MLAKCGFVGCHPHRVKVDRRPWLCRFGIHRHYKVLDGWWRECSECEFRWHLTAPTWMSVPPYGFDTSKEPPSD